MGKQVYKPVHCMWSMNWTVDHELNCMWTGLTIGLCTIDFYNYVKLFRLTAVSTPLLKCLMTCRWTSESTTASRKIKVLTSWYGSVVKALTAMLLTTHVHTSSGDNMYVLKI